MEDRKVIESFVAHLQGSGHPGLKIDRWPDRENRNSPEIDAIAGKFAIEHTSVDTLPHQRSDSDRFGQVIEGLEEGDEVYKRLPRNREGQEDLGEE